MSFTKFWQRLLIANPSLAQPGVKLTLGVESLKVQLLKAYEAGYEDRRAVEKACEALGGKRDDPFDGLFKGVFGR